jgi:hypothetical protein
MRINFFWPKGLIFGQFVEDQTKSDHKMDFFSWWSGDYIKKVFGNEKKQN